MGKGDRRSKKGKIKVGSYGNARPNPKKEKKETKEKLLAKKKSS